MKPTRHIVTPIKGLWNSKRKVWFQKNDDASPEVREEFEKAKEECGNTHHVQLIKEYPSGRDIVRKVKRY